MYLTEVNVYSKLILQIDKKQFNLSPLVTTPVDKVCRALRIV